MTECNLKIKIRDLLLSNDFKKLTEKKSKVNIFKILNITYREMVHSDMLAWLLKPYESHGLNDNMLKKLIMYLSKKNAEYINLFLQGYSDLEVYREYTIDNGRRIDIVMKSRNNKVIFIIENKIWSEESDKQLEDYKDYINKKYCNYKKFFLYLTPEKERKETYKGYIHISYNTIYCILKNLLWDYHISPYITSILLDYSEIIRGDIMGEVDREIIELCRKIYVEHTEVLDKIMQYGNTTYYLTEVIHDIVQSEPYNEGEVIFKQKGQIVYLPYCKNETREKLQCGFDKIRENLALTISIEIEKDNVKLYLQGSNRSINNTTEQDISYNQLKEIYEKELKKEINRWGWYVLCNKKFTNKTCINDEKYIKKIKDILEDNLAELIDEFNKIISIFENKI